MSLAVANVNVEIKLALKAERQVYFFNKLITNVSDTCYLIYLAEKSKYFLGTRLGVWLDKIISLCWRGRIRQAKQPFVLFRSPFLLNSQNNIEIAVLKESIFLGDNPWERQGKSGLSLRFFAKILPRGSAQAAISVCGGELQSSHPRH